MTVWVFSDGAAPAEERAQKTPDFAPQAQAGAIEGSQR